MVGAFLVSAADTARSTKELIRKGVEHVGKDAMRTIGIGEEP